MTVEVETDKLSEIAVIGTSQLIPEWFSVDDRWDLVEFFLTKEVSCDSYFSCVLYIENGEKLNRIRVLYPAL